MEQTRICFTAERLLDAAREIRKETGKIPGTVEILQKYREGEVTMPRPEEIPSVLVSPRDLADAVMRFPMPLPEVCEIEAVDDENIEPEDRGLLPEGWDVFCLPLIGELERPMMTSGAFWLYYVISGTAEIVFNDDRQELSKGDLCVVPPYVRHRLLASENSLSMGILARRSSFDARFGAFMSRPGMLGSFFREALQSDRDDNRLLLHTGEPGEEIAHSLLSMMAEILRNDAYSAEAVYTAARLFFISALRGCGNVVENHNVLTRGGSKGDYSAILEYITMNYRTVRLSSLAEKFHYNETYLSRLIQSFSGKNFTEIVRDVRMERAEEYLRNSDLRIREISSLVGYTSVDHFSRAFRIVHGESPQAWRRAARKKAPEA